MTPLEYRLLEQNLSGKSDELLLYFIYLSQERLASSFEDFFRKNYNWSPNQTRVMCYLKFQRIISMSELASLVRSSRQHMTQIVDSLVKLDLAERKYDPQNRRAVYVQPTVTGLKRLDTGERRFISHLQRAISKLPAEERQKTIEAIRTVSVFLGNINIEIDDKADVIF